MNKNLNLWYLIAAVMLLSMQVLAVIIYMYSFVPLVWDESFWANLEPTRDPLFYYIFLGLNFLLMAAGVKWLLPRLQAPSVYAKFKVWLLCESIWCFLIWFCFFKWTTYRYPFWNILPYENQAWLRPFFCAVCALAVLSKIFFPEIEKFYRHLKIEAGKQPIPQYYILAFQAAFIMGVVLLLYVPRPEDVAALGLAWDQFNHLDSIVGWFIKHGWYLSYEQTIQILVAAAIAYIIGLFYFIRVWLGSFWLAAIGALMAIKLGMFYYGTAPCVWANPGNTFLAHGWDIILFFGLWFISVKQPKAFYPSAILLGIILVVIWIKSNGYIQAFGFENQPMMAPLRVRQFFPYFMGYFLPVFYVFSLLAARVIPAKAGIQYQEHLKDQRFLKAVCIYGLMIFINYIAHPMIGFYGSLMVPAILVMLWWVQQLFSRSVLFVKRGVYAGILLVVTGALLTNRLMLIYPNTIFQNAKLFERERLFYQQFDAIKQSAALVRQLMTEDQKVALLSNFEVGVLMQAHRAPLFKNFPVMFSNFGNNPGGLRLKTKKQCLDLINSIQDENPQYVFVDTRVWALSSQALGNSGLNTVLSYICDHYQIYGHQGFLVALQKK